MIDPKLLTPEVGLVEGCVVEIEWEDYISNQIEFYVWGSSINHEQKIYQISQYGQSIRPLTGPMAIWNHAPDWADVLVRQNGDEPCRRGLIFATKDVPYILGSRDTIEERPFWAT